MSSVKTNETNEEIRNDFVSTSFDTILTNKIAEINELYEIKTKNKKMTSNVNEINFMDKQLYNKINEELLNYTPESYRKNIYPFSSDKYTKDFLINNYDILKYYVDNYFIFRDNNEKFICCQLNGCYGAFRGTLVAELDNLSIYIHNLHECDHKREFLV